MFLTQSQQINGASRRKTSNIYMPVICYELTITNIKLSIKYWNLVLKALGKITKYFPKE